MPVISKDPPGSPALGMKRSLVAPPMPMPVAAAAPVAAPSPAVETPTEFERKFVVPASTLTKVLTIRGVERRMVYDTYIEAEVKGFPRLRFRFETSIDPLLGNSEDGSVVIAYADFTVKTGGDASKRKEAIYPLAFHCPNPVATINAFSTIYGARIQTERFRWSGMEGNFQLVVHSAGPGGQARMIVELETASETELHAFKPHSSWREVTHDPRYSNYSIAACGWPEEAASCAAT